jgi:hypothetical protein
MSPGEGASDRARLRRVPSNELTASEIRAIRELLWAAFPSGDQEFTEDDWQHAIGGLHFVLELDGKILAHASVVDASCTSAGGRCERATSRPSRRIRTSRAGALAPG